MSAKKKPWAKSAFSDLNLTPKVSSTAEPVRRTRSASAAAADIAPRKSQRNANATPTSLEVVDLTVDNGTDENSETPVVSENWMESFAPSSSDDLSVHPKKLDEVRNWFRHCDAVRAKFPAQICLLTGPAGSGKTATIRVLAQEQGYELQEWINPVDCEEVHELGDQLTGNSYAASQQQAFKSFLLRASRYKSLLAKQDKRLLLVEDIPNFLLKDAAAPFAELLEEYSSYGKSPLVFIIADSKSKILNISYKLFTDELKAKLRIEHISFNAIATTIMQRSMKRFCTLMQQPEQKALYKPPTQTVMDSIVVCAQGDIRNALINLHFGSLRGAPIMATKQLNVSVAGKSRKRKATSTLKSIGRDESITMMHALGRVFNPKYNENKPDSLLHCPEHISESFCTMPMNFVSFIHANYLPHFKDISDVKSAVDDMGLADMLLQEYRDDSLALVGLTVAVRGCMVSNVAPVSGWLPVRAPRRITAQPQVSAGELKLMGTTYAGISKSLYASEYSSFVKLIAGKTGHHSMNCQ